jgi:hypothetical protein
MKTKRVATLVLNRNLPKPTDELVEHIQKYDEALTDVFVIEAGSDKNKLSKYTTWHAEWDEAKKQGLRYSRGMNYGLSNLWASNEFEKYDAFFLLTNDTILRRVPTIKPLIDILDQNRRIGILSPCSKTWGELHLLANITTKYFWYIHNAAYLIKREFIESVCNTESPGWQNFLFDGTNFRGYGAESELIAKAYINDFAAAITKDAWAEEDQTHLQKHADLIKTENYEANISLYIEEGNNWMKSKYGFSSKWHMQQYVQLFYDKFFEFHPEELKYKI